MATIFRRGCRLRFLAALAVLTVMHWPSVGDDWTLGFAVQPSRYARIGSNLRAGAEDRQDRLVSYDPRTVERERQPRIQSQPRVQRESRSRFRRRAARQTGATSQCRSPKYAARSSNSSKRLSRLLRNRPRLRQPTYRQTPRTSSPEAKAASGARTDLDGGT